jgi:hypothetical protein
VTAKSSFPTARPGSEQAMEPSQSRIQIRYGSVPTINGHKTHILYEREYEEVKNSIRCHLDVKLLFCRIRFDLHGQVPPCRAALKRLTFFGGSSSRRLAGLVARSITADLALLAKGETDALALASISPALNLDGFLADDLTTNSAGCVTRSIIASVNGVF